MVSVYIIIGVLALAAAAGVAYFATTHNLSSNSTSTILSSNNSISTSLGSTTILQNLNQKIYCTGGIASGGHAYNNTYYADVSSQGIGRWANTTPMPTTFPQGEKTASQSCVAYNGYMYCVGGTDSSAILNNTYYAQITPDGLGPWISTAAYPVGIESEACVAYNGYIYCTFGETNSYLDTNASYYAPLSSSGIGAWKSTTPYPLQVANHNCVVDSGNIYCDSSLYAYFAPLSDKGISAWSASSKYLYGTLQANCAWSNRYVYCIGYDAANPANTPTMLSAYASVGADGSVGQFYNTNAYPINATDLSCTIG